ncbi:hypothetical protein JCM19240_4460 [Vibrio maritimus]|uniref:Uncharacterized protein n=1 Tax=Vibrio maritimus TaxID=990268 RepID=A0A090T4L9_9VIBR|nr:hypothetical protein JCM19240_4460 [Vibrio maritimus]
MGNNQYNRETLTAGYWVLHNFHYGHVAEARCNLELVKSISIHKAPSADTINISLDLVAEHTEGPNKIELLLSDGQVIKLSDYVDYQCARGVTRLLRCLIPTTYAPSLVSESGFAIRIDNIEDRVDTQDASNIIDNAIRHAH